MKKVLRNTCVNKMRSEEHTSELQSRLHLVCRLLLEKTKEEIHLCIGNFADPHFIDIIGSIANTPPDAAVSNVQVTPQQPQTACAPDDCSACSTRLHSS